MQQLRQERILQNPGFPQETSHLVGLHKYLLSVYSCECACLLNQALQWRVYSQFKTKMKVTSIKAEAYLSQKCLFFFNYSFVHSSTHILQRWVNELSTKIDREASVGCSTVFVCLYNDAMLCSTFLKGWIGLWLMKCAIRQHAALCIPSCYVDTVHKCWMFCHKWSVLRDLVRQAVYSMLVQQHRQNRDFQSFCITSR